MKIVRIALEWAKIPARPDSINSPEIDHALHMLPFGGQAGWKTQFDAIPKAMVRVETDDGLVGWGESNRGLPKETLCEIASTLIGLDLATVNAQELPIPSGRLYDGFECAILDAIGKAVGLPLYRLLGGAYRTEVACGYWTGHRTVADAARKAREGKDRGYDCIKFKCQWDDPVVAWCAAVRDACGPDFRIILDPNQRFNDRATAARLARGLAEVGNVYCLEDPIPKGQTTEWRLLRESCAIPLAAHIALPYPELDSFPYDMVRHLEAGSCDYFNVNGGVFPVKRLMTIADTAGKPYWHGSEVDFGPLEASYLHKCASGKLATIPSDIFGRLVREHDLLTAPLDIDAGRGVVPQGPGLGVEIDLDALAHYRVDSWSTEAPGSSVASPTPGSAGPSPGGAREGNATEEPGVGDATEEPVPLKRRPGSASQHVTAGPYSPSLIVAAGAQLVAISGQGPINPQGYIVGGTIEAQARKTLENCRDRLAEAGATFADVFKVMVYLDTMDDWPTFNAIYREWMPEPYPVRTAIACKLWGGMLVEIDMLAAVRAEDPQSADTEDPG